MRIDQKQISNSNKSDGLIKIICGNVNKTNDDNNVTQELKNCLCIPLNIFVLKDIEDKDGRSWTVDKCTLKHWQDILNREGLNALEIAFQNVKACKCD